MSETQTARSDGLTARHSSETVDHYTPPDIVAMAWRTMAGIDLDPASSADAPAAKLAKEWFDAKDNGFARAWRGRAFLNPPGGRCDANGVMVAPDKARGKGFFYADGSPCRGPAQAAAKAWWFKLAREIQSGRVTQAVFVGFSVEILQTTQVDAPAGLILPLDCALCFPSRRVAYIKPNGEVGGSPPHSSVIVYAGPNNERFREMFGPLGRVLAPGGAR